MKKKSRFEWQKRICDHALTLPAELRDVDDMTLASVLEDVICAEQTRMKDPNLATLVGVAAALARRHMDRLPRPSHVTAAGERVYTEAEVAAHLGVSVEEVRRRAEAIEREHPDAGITALVDSDQLRRVN
jgi:hypothetical protein